MRRKWEKHTNTHSHSHRRTFIRKENVKIRTVFIVRLLLRNRILFRVLFLLWFFFYHWKYALQKDEEKKLLWYVCDQDKYVFDACGNLFTRIRICCCCWSCLWMLSDSVSASCILSFSFSSSLSASSFSSHVYPVNDARKTSILARIKDFQFSIFMRIHTICVRFLLSKCVKRHAYLNHRKSTVCHLKSNASTRMRE